MKWFIYLFSDIYIFYYVLKNDLRITNKRHDDDFFTHYIYIIWRTRVFPRMLCVTARA